MLPRPARWRYQAQAPGSNACSIAYRGGHAAAENVQQAAYDAEPVRAGLPDLLEELFRNDCLAARHHVILCWNKAAQGFLVEVIKQKAARSRPGQRDRNADLR